MTTTITKMWLIRRIIVLAVVCKPLYRVLYVSIDHKYCMNWSYFLFLCFKKKTSHTCETSVDLTAVPLPHLTSDLQAVFSAQHSSGCHRSVQETHRLVQEEDRERRAGLRTHRLDV